MNKLEGWLEKGWWLPALYAVGGGLAIGAILLLDYLGWLG